MYPSPPPHERAWRHPSELGAPSHEPTTTGGRVLILTTATFSLLLVGLLAISMTPEQAGTPEAVSSTVSGVRAIPPSALTRVSLPMVTPVGNDGMAITTLDALGENGQQLIEARLPSGEIVQGEVVATSGGLALVELPAAVEPEGLDLAAAAGDPTPHDTVMVHSAEPVVVSVAEIEQLRVDEGTPVTDADGRLVGLCTGEDEMWLRTVVSLPVPPATAASTTPPTVAVTMEPTTDASTATAPQPTAAPTSSPEPTSTEPASTAPSTAPSTAERGGHGEAERSPRGDDDAISGGGDASDGPG